jgi:hypothetical protein
MRSKDVGVTPIKGKGSLRWGGVRGGGCQLEERKIEERGQLR